MTRCTSTRQKASGFSLSIPYFSSVSLTTCAALSLTDKSNVLYGTSGFTRWPYIFSVPPEIIKPPQMTGKQPEKEIMILKYTLNNDNNNHLTALCPGLPRWAGTKINIYPLTRLRIINRPLSASSIYHNSQHPPCQIYVLNSLFA